LKFSTEKKNISKKKKQKSSLYLINHNAMKTYVSETPKPAEENKRKRQKENWKKDEKKKENKYERRRSIS
jgi:hypothetical protein